MKNNFLVFLLFTFLFSTRYLPAQTKKSIATKLLEIRATNGYYPQNSKHIDLLLELAKEKIRVNPDTSLILLKQGIELSRKAHYKAGESTALSTFGYYYFERGEIDKAYSYNTRALNIANQYNLGKQKLKALNNMGLDFLLQGESAQALTKFLEGLTVAKEIEDLDMRINLNVNIANLYSENEDYEMSLAFLKKAHSLSKSNNNTEIIAYNLLNMSAEYLKLEDYDEAENFNNQSITYFEKENKIDWLAHAYEQKGTIALKKKKFEEAITWLDKSKKLCDKIDFKYGYTLVYNRLSEAYLGKEKLKEAQKYALEGLQISTELNIASSIEKSNFLLSQINNKLSNYKLAYEYQNEYIKLFKKSSSDKQKNGLGILKSEIKFEDQKKQLITEQNKAIAKQKTYFFTSLLVSLIVLAFLISFYRTNKLQKVYTEKLKEKQDKLIEHEAELSASNKTKDKLFSIIAHDLKGPINSFYELMNLSSKISISKEEYDILIPKATEEIHGISTMLNNLLFWSKTQLQGIVLEKENIDINAITEKTILVLNPLAHKKQINIINEVPQNIITYSDQNHLEIIMRNIISNAIKFTNNNGSIIIKVKEITNALQIEIKDDGIGMDSEKKELLFKSDYMKSTYGTNHEKGTGLGLSICKEMVEANGGEIWVQSKLNKGTTIYFTLPLKFKEELALNMA